MSRDVPTAGRPADDREAHRRPRSGSPARAKTRNVARRDLDAPRRVAFAAVRAVDEDDAYANLVLPRLLREAKLTGRDAAFATELAYGALRSKATYDAVLARCIDRPLADVDPPVLDALRLGAHQLLAMRVPSHAAVAATVDLVRAEIGQGAAGFANAVLRKVDAHDLADWVAQAAPDQASDPDGYLAVAYSHPVWIVRALRDALRLAGRDPAELPDLLGADNERPRVTLAVLPGFHDPSHEQPPVGSAGVLSPLARVITGAPHEVPGVRNNEVRVQDEGSQLVALALGAAPLIGTDTGRWLDLAAGPGGKAAVLAALLGVAIDERRVPADAVLVANEVAPHRTALVEQAVSAVVRRHPGLVTTRTGDGRTLEDHPWAGTFDRVLIDAPCTGLGALRRRPEARWRRQPADLSTLGPLQRQLLTAALDLVRPGGVVAYATCSPHPAETRLVVDDVLRRRDDVERLDARAVASTAIGRDLPDAGPGPDVQLWPHVHGTDAMFLSLLRRKVVVREF